MRTAKTRVSDVSAVVVQLVEQDVRAATGANTLLSRAEQATAPRHIREAAEEVRASMPRVTQRALQHTLEERARRVVGAVNQAHGPGAPFLSRAEARRAAATDAALGPLVLRAQTLASGGGVDVDQLARERVSSHVDPAEGVFKTFATENEAQSYADPDGRHVTWLVAMDDGVLKKRFVWGRNDLWAERFDLDRLTGAVTVVAEH